MTLLRIAARSTVVLIMAVTVAAAARHGSDPVVVGVLENPPFRCDDDGDTVAVRALFRKADGRWTALNDEASFRRAVAGSMSWTVAFDNRNIGAIRTTVPRPLRDRSLGWSTRNDGVLMLAAGQQPPQRVTPGVEFSGWCNAPKRPLVTVSRPHFTDPDGWRPFQPAPDMRDAARRAFRAAVGTVFDCTPGTPAQPPLRYVAEDIEIVRAYRSRRGLAIVAVRFAARLHACAADDGPDDPTTSTHWFLMENVPTRIGIDLQLVDAGDYDADGRSELLFAYSGYNADGYWLFADDFGMRVAVRWSYH